MRFLTAGESHGEGLSVLVDGFPAGVTISPDAINHQLARRQIGYGRGGRMKIETDRARILSGVRFQKSTGAPIALFIENRDWKNWTDVMSVDGERGEAAEAKSFIRPRPGHADLTYFLKYGIRDYRGGGRSSARETACRVAAGAVARKVINHILKKDIIIQGAVTQVGKLAVNPRNFNWKEVRKNNFFSPDKKIVKVWEEYLTTTRKKGSSLGAKIVVNAKNVPAGLGEPVYGKLDAELAAAMMSINAVKGVEIGSGNDSIELTGDQNSDELRMDKRKKITFSSNNSGGILGGISSGQNIDVSITVKPTSSILKSQKTINNKFKNTTISTKGRHDPCVGLRAVPIAEAMMACVLADQIMRNKAQCG